MNSLAKLLLPWSYLYRHCHCFNCSSTHSHCIIFWYHDLTYDVKSSFVWCMLVSLLSFSISLCYSYCLHCSCTFFSTIIYCENENLSHQTIPGYETSNEPVQVHRWLLHLSQSLVHVLDSWNLTHPCHGLTDHNTSIRFKPA